MRGGTCKSISGRGGVAGSFSYPYIYIHTYIYITFSLSLNRETTSHTALAVQLPQKQQLGDAG